MTMGASRYLQQYLAIGKGRYVSRYVHAETNRDTSPLLRDNYFHQTDFWYLSVLDR